MPLFTITSRSPSTGKSFLARLMAQVLSRKGRKVLLVSFDFSHPEKGTQDLMSVLREDITLAQAISHDPLKGFDLILGNCGQRPPIPFASARLDLLADDLSILSKEYDFVLLDLPFDFLFFARPLTDLFYVVLTPDVRTLSETYRTLQNLPAHSVRLVINRLRDKPEGQRLYSILTSIPSSHRDLMLGGLVREGRTAAFDDLEEMFE